MRRPLPFLVGLAVLAAGCGGNPSYSLGPTRECLRDERVRIDTNPSDFVASTATGGAFRAYFGRNFVTVAFGDTEEDAEQIEDAYARFAAPNVRAVLADLLRRDQNAVMVWREHPADDDLATLDGCLK